MKIDGPVDFESFDHHEIKRVGQSFYILTFFSSILADNVVNYL